MSMTYGIEMDVIDVALEIALIADLMLVKAALPDRGITMLDA